MGLLVQRPAPRWAAASVFSALLLLSLARPSCAQAPTFTSPDGQESFKLGILAQLQGEALDTPDARHSQDNLFFRRLRLLGAVKVGERLSVFFDTDSPNLGKGATNGVKNNANIFIQDFIVTYAFSHALQVDGGFMFTPNDYNHLTSAGALLGLDFGAYTFTESAPLGGINGRDYGADLRGYLAGDHVEYRVGVFQGARGTNSTNSFRSAGRLAIYFWGAETGFFYTGGSLGKTATFSLGGAFDVQRAYHNYTFDFFFDQPVGNGDGFTVQGDYQMPDGKDFLTTLPKQKDIFLEAGYYFGALRLQPFVQYAKQSFAVVAANNEHRTGFGLGYYLKGNTSNLKFAWTRIDHQNVKTRNDLVLQYQLFVW